MPETRKPQWVARKIKSEGYETLGEFLRDLVIEAYDNRHNALGGANGKAA